MEYYPKGNKFIISELIKNKKIFTLEEIANELDSTIILATLLEYKIEYIEKIYSNKVFFIIDISLPSNKLLRIKLGLKYYCNENILLNICLIEIPNIMKKFDNISITYDINDTNIIQAIKDFKKKF